MKRLKILRRWFTRKFGFARLGALRCCRVCGLRIGIRRRSRTFRLRTFDMFQLHRPPGQDGAAGHHRRHRRQEPGQARPVAVAADADRGPDHQPHQQRRVAIGFDVVFSEPDRLKPDRRGPDALSRRRDRPSCANCRATTSSLRRDQALARGLGETGLPEVITESTSAALHRRRDGRRGGRRSVSVRIPGLLRNVPVIEWLPAGRGLFSIKTERDGLIRACR